MTFVQKYFPSFLPPPRQTTVDIVDKTALLYRILQKIIATGSNG